MRSPIEEIPPISEERLAAAAKLSSLEARFRAMNSAQAVLRSRCLSLYDIEGSEASSSLLKSCIEENNRVITDMLDELAVIMHGPHGDLIRGRQLPLNG
jgi:hypothetical protein